MPTLVDSPEGISQPTMQANQANNTQPRKRPRAGSDSDAAQGEENLQVKREGIERHEELWFEDGSVVLVAANVGFRVHASILCRHSVVLGDLLHGPGASLEELDGCPVLRLPDTTADLSVLLTFLYAGIDSAELSVKKLPFSDVASLIRLGHKYQVYRLRDNGLVRLKSCFPDTWSDTNFAPFVDNESSVMSMASEDAISTVNLARLTQTTSILPMALYGCCHLSVSTLLSGTHRPDGTVDKLSSEDLIRCLEGKEKLMAVKRLSAAWTFQISLGNGCIASAKCIKTLRSLPRVAHHGNILSTFRALNSLQWAVPEIWKDLCLHCGDMVEFRDANARRGIFAKLPSCMGVAVEGWPT